MADGPMYPWVFPRTTKAVEAEAERLRLLRSATGGVVVRTLEGDTVVTEYDADRAPKIADVLQRHLRPVR